MEFCTCPTQFPMIRVSEGKYRIGDTKMLIFVRVNQHLIHFHSFVIKIHIFLKFWKNISNFVQFKWNESSILCKWSRWATWKFNGKCGNQIFPPKKFVDPGQRHESAAIELEMISALAFSLFFHRFRFHRIVRLFGGNVANRCENESKSI